MQPCQRARLERGQLGLQALLELLHVADAQREEVQQRRQVALLLGADQGPPGARPRGLERRLDLRRLLVAQQGRAKGPDACSGMSLSAQGPLMPSLACAQSGQVQKCPPSSALNVIFKPYPPLPIPHRSARPPKRPCLCTVICDIIALYIMQLQ